MRKVKKGRKLWGRLVPVGVLFGEGERVRFWGLSRVLSTSITGIMNDTRLFYQNWRKNPRRALIVLDGMKEPVKLKGKK